MHWVNLMLSCHLYVIAGLKLCELPKKVFVHVSEPSGDDSYYVEVIGGPVVGFVIIVLGLVISWNICRLRSRPQRYRALGEICI